jgi:phage repressor protein C with HTH and peptisase S24 domain
MPVSSSLSDRLRKVRELKGLTQKQFATSLGLGLNSWQKWETNGLLPPSDVLAQLAKTGISIDWLITGDGKMHSIASQHFDVADLTHEIFNRVVRQRLDDAFPQESSTQQSVHNESEFVLVPRYDIQASAGPGAFNDEEQIVDWLAFSRDWVRTTLRVDPKWLVLLSAVGDSMEPTIRAGDLLLVDRSVGAFRDDAIYVLQIAGQLMVKRVQRFFGGAVVVKSDNSSAYVEQTLTKEEAAAAQVAGRVRWIGRMI